MKTMTKFTLIFFAIGIFITSCQKDFETTKGYLPIKDGCLAWYPFNSGASDESGNKNNGSVYGAILTKDRFDEINSAYTFDGVRDWIEVNSLNGNYNNITISFWFKNYEAMVYYPCYFHWVNMCWVNQGSWNPYKSGDIVFIPGNSGLNKLNFPSYDEWHHFVINFNYLEEKITIYLDNEKEVYYSGTSWNTSYVTKNNNFLDQNSLNGKNSGNLIIGNFDNVGAKNCQYTGDIDDFGVWNRSLTDEEVDILYHAK